MLWANAAPSASAGRVVRTITYSWFIGLPRSPGRLAADSCADLCFIGCVRPKLLYKGVLTIDGCRRTETRTEPCRPHGAAETDTCGAVPAVCVPAADRSLPA